MNENQLRSFLKLRVRVYKQGPNSWNWYKRVDQMSYDQLVEESEANERRATQELPETTVSE
jgi:(2Fe-2S) ferredoxin